ncbi:MAG: hypothetical protein R3E66_19565 [bacterium]
MKTSPKLAANAKGSFWTNRTASERRYIIALGVTFAVLAVAVSVLQFRASMDSIDEEANNYKSALDYLAVAGPEFVSRKASKTEKKSHKKIDEETLATNNLKLTSFVAEHAAAAQITVTSYDESSLPFGGSGKKDDGPIILEKQLRVEIRDAEMTKLLDLLDRIEKSPEPVFIKRLDVRDQKKPGEIRAVVTVSTFVKKEKAT